MRFRTFLNDYTKKSFKMMIIKKICIICLINNSNILILINVLPIPLMKFDKFYFSDHLKKWYNEWHFSDFLMPTFLFHKYMGHLPIYRNRIVIIITCLILWKSKIFFSNHSIHIEFFFYKYMPLSNILVLLFGLM